MSDMDDTELLKRYGAGEMVAARLLTRRLGPRILAFATRMTGSRAEAEDITQEVMLRLWRKAPDWEDRGIAPLSWALQVTANLCRDHFRRKAPSALEEAPEPLDQTLPVDEQLIIEARQKALNHALAKLPDRQREAVILRHIEGLPNPETAAIMEIGVEAVESLVARGKRKLAQILTPAKEEIGYE